MFCKNCGAEIDEKAFCCPKCGVLTDERKGDVAAATNEKDAPNGGFAVLGFFIPVIGLILWLTWKATLPLKAKSCGKGALIGVITNVVFIVLYVIIMVVGLGYIWS